MTHRHQRRTRSCGLLTIIFILLIVLLVQLALSSRKPAPVEPPTETPIPTFISRDAVVPLPTSTPHLDLTPLPTFTLTPTFTVTPTSTHTPTITPTPTLTLTPTATPHQPLIAEVGVELANLRAGPGPDYETIVILGQGESVLLTARNAAGDWLFGRSELGQQGWIFIDMLLFGDDVLLLPGRMTPTPPPVATPDAS